MTIVEEFGEFTYYQDDDRVIYAPTRLIEKFKNSSYKCIIFIPGAIIYNKECIDAVFEKLDFGGALLEIDDNRILITDDGTPVFIANSMKNYEFINMAIKKMAADYEVEADNLSVYSDYVVYTLFHTNKLLYISDEKVGVFPLINGDIMYKHVITPEKEYLKPFIRGEHNYGIKLDSGDITVSINEEILLTISDIFDTVVDEIVFEKYDPPKIDPLKLTSHGKIYSKIATVEEINDEDVEIYTPAGRVEINRINPDPLNLYIAKMMFNRNDIFQVNRSYDDSFIFKKKQVHTIYARVAGKVLWRDYSEEYADFARDRIRVSEGTLIYDKIIFTDHELAQKILNAKDPKKYVYPGFPNVYENLDIDKRIYVTPERIFYFDIRYKKKHIEINIPFVEGLYKLQIPYNTDVNIDYHLSVRTLPDFISFTPVIEIYPPRKFYQLLGGINYIGFRLADDSYLIVGTDNFTLVTDIAAIDLNEHNSKFYSQINLYLLDNGIGREFPIDAYDPVIYMLDKGYTVKDILTIT